MENLKQKLEQSNARFKLHEVPVGTGVSVDDHIRAFGLDYSDGCATLIFATPNGLVGLMRRDDTRIDNKKFKEVLGVRDLRIATPIELKDQTGFDVAMVSPILLPEGFPLFIDAKVLEKETVRVGTGNNEFSLEINVEDLVRVTGAKVVDVSAPNERGSVRKRILTGDRPTGPLHLGHLVGSLQNRAELQDEYDTFILVADVQALTDNYDNPEKVRQNVYQVVQDNIVAGVDPEKVTFFIQSQIPQIAELTVFFMNLVRHSEVLRNPTVKAEIDQKGFGESVPFGFVAYPVSQAADIQIVRADLVPTGDDQNPMIELADHLGERFNKTYKTSIFHPVKGRPSKFGRLVGTDGNSKMSKSLGNTIYLMDTPEQVKEKVMKMYTDPNRIRATDPGQVEGNPVFIYHDAFNQDKAEVEDLKQRYLAGTVGDVEVKEKLARAINLMLEPMHARRAQYPLDKVKEIVKAGTEKALKEAEKTMQMVREAMRIDY